MLRVWCMGVLIVGVGIVSACGGGSSSQSAADRAQTPPVNAAPAAAAPPGAQTSAAPGAGKPLNVGDIFPPGKGRDLVLDTCGSCHPVACTARGQRTATSWDSIKQGHQDKVTSMSEADLGTLFAYLKENFNDKKPEPVIPAEFLQQSCTPF